MTTSRLTIVTSMLILIGSAGFAHAQFGATGGNSGGFGSSSGGSSFGSSSGGGSSLGNSTGTQGTFGSRSIGSGTLSGASSGRSLATGANGANAGTGQVSTNKNANGRAGFIGGNAQNAQALASQLTGGLAGQNQGGLNTILGGGNRNNNRNGNNNNNMLQQQQQQNGMQNGQPALRTILVPAFDYPLPSGAQFNAELGDRLTSLLKDRALSPIQASVEGRKVVLKGAVATEHDRVLAEKLALLEPGVGSVENDLVVRPKGLSELPAPK